MDYCDDCGNELKRQEDHDPMCWLHPAHHTLYCENCGEEPTTTAIIPQFGQPYMLCQRCQLPSKIHAVCELVEAR